MEVFTPEMIANAKKCNNAEEIRKFIIEPNMDYINRMTGQINDPRYWAYAMEFTLKEMERRESARQNGH